MSRLNYVGQSAHYKTPQLADLRLMNAYAEVVESKQGTTVTLLQGTPGCKLFTTMHAGGPVRALYVSSDQRLFAAQGNAFVEIFSTGALVQWGFLNSLSGPVSMVDNGIQLMIVDGPDGYVFTLATNLFVVINDGNFPGSTHVNFIDGYFIFPVAGTQRFGWTDPLSVTFDALNYTSVEGNPDVLLSQLVVHREIWNFGRQTTEVFFDTGDTDTPFIPIQGAFIHQGCVAPFSPARVGETVCWLSQNDEGQAMVLQASGYTPQRISTHPIEEAMQGYAVLADALGWGQQTRGHLFYWLTFPTANVTWVYDTTTGLWHERGAWEPVMGTIGRHRANCYTFAFGKHLVGDYGDGRLYELDPLTYADDGVALVFQASLPPLFDPEGGYRVRHDRLQLLCKTGVGLDGSPALGTDPQVELHISNDGGATYPWIRPMDLGAIGAVRTQVEWRQLGSAYDRRYRVHISDPIERQVFAAVTDYEVLGA
jgi:hypothetical protein